MFVSSKLKWNMRKAPYNAGLSILMTLILSTYQAENHLSLR